MARLRLDNGCVCCGPGAGELAPAVASLRDRRVNNKPAFDHVVVELSGVADPTNVQANLKAGGVGVDRRVALVDANSFPALYNSQAAMVDRLDLAGATELWADPCAVDRAVVDLLLLQVETADVVLVNKADLATAEERPGSWWPDWEAWLCEKSGEMVPARKPGSGKLKVLEDAPGSYVLVKSED